MLTAGRPEAVDAELTGLNFPVNHVDRALGCLPVRKGLSWGLLMGKNRRG